MLTLNLTIDKVAYAAPADPRITIRLINAGPEAAIVNKRLAVNYADAADDECEIKLAVTAPSGDDIPFTARVNLGEPEDRHFTTLGPGESIERAYALLRAYDVRATGIYAVRAMYQNQTDPSSGSSWKGVISSNIVTFSVD